MRSVDICEAPSWSSRSASSSGSSGTGNPAAGFLSRQERAQVARLRKWGASCGTDLRALEARVTAFFKDDHEDKKATDRVDTKIEDDKDGGELFQNDFIVLENSDVSNSSWSVVDESDSDAASESSISTVASSSAPSAASSECESDSSCREAVLGRKWIMTHAGRGFNAREKEWAGGWCQVERNDGSGKDTLWLIVRDPLLRVLVHWIARFYGLESSSFDDASIGERMTRVCGSGAQGQGGNRGRRKEQRRGVEAAGAEGTFAAFFLPVSRA
ncbi:hypothetical protein HDU83_005038 [Entophlyctis luteolus]|nr:hypothetical protein HDU83_005038 [Entophlyctis luteolus]